MCIKNLGLTKVFLKLGLKSFMIQASFKPTLLQKILSYYNNKNNEGIKIVNIPEMPRGDCSIVQVFIDIPQMNL